MSTLVWKGLHRLSFLLPRAHTTTTGYLQVRYPEHPRVNSQGCVLLHRIIMENRLGRYLDPKEVVHHRDLDKTNNQIENLELCANTADHMRKHYEQGTMGFDRKVEWPPDDEMVALLDHDSFGSVARHLDISRSSVLRWCRQHDYEAKPDKCWQMKSIEEMRPPKEELKVLVWEKSARALAVQLDVSYQTILDWCCQLDIERPPAGYWNRKDLPDREELRQVLDQSITAAAHYYGVQAATVSRWAEALDLSCSTRCGVRKKERVIDEQLFQACYSRVLSGEIVVGQAQVLLGLPGKRFAAECKKRGLRIDYNRGRTAASAKLRQYSLPPLVDAAALVQTGETTISAAAASLGIASCTFHRRCAKHGLKLPRGGTAKSRSVKLPPREELTGLLAEGVTCIKLARKYKVNANTITRWTRLYGISVHNPYLPKEAPPKSELEQLLWKHPKTQIRELLGVRLGTLRKWIRQYNIIDVPPRGYWVRKENRKRGK